MKKGDLSLNVIASAVIVLVVIIVLIIIFTGKISLLSGSISSCESKPGGKCVSSCPTQEDEYFYSQKMDFKCSDNNLICCYSQCKASGGKCKQGCSDPNNDLGAADCNGGEVCCKEN